MNMILNQAYFLNKLKMQIKIDIHYNTLDYIVCQYLFIVFRYVFIVIRCVYHDIFYKRGIIDKVCQYIFKVLI